jgi:NAD(P)-dependent dehydrogenase (short-subunit alcohol dehydrogenase family)
VKKLEGKVVVITGAARGLGRAYALRLAGLGADVVVGDINLDSYREFGEELTAPTVVEEVRALGVRGLGVITDVTKQADCAALIRRAIEELGHVDVLVNNAGGILRPLERGFASSMPEDDYRFIMDINLTSAVFCAQAVAPHMKARGGGKIINVSSQAGLQGNSTGAMAHYGVAKAGIVEYTRLLAGELGPYGITVNAIAPGLIQTVRARVQFGRGATPERAAEEAKGIPLRRLGTAEDCAKVVEFLATDLSDYVTGQVIAVCGGMVLFPS